MKKFFVPVVAVLLFGTVSANAQTASTPAKPQPKAATTTTAQKAPASQAKPATAAAPKTNSVPATKPAAATTSSATKPATAKAETATADTAKPKKAHRLHRKAKSQTSSQPTGTSGGTAQKSKANKQ